MTTLFTESAVAPVKAGDNWRAVLITPGKGSSGIYTESMLKEYGPLAFPKGTHSYVDHPVSEGEVRSPKNLMGVLAEDAYYDESAGGLVAELQVMPHWKDFVEAVAPHTGLSIYAMGEGNRNEEGDIVVESLVPNIQNSVDLVSYAGRPGSGLAEKLYESALAAQMSDNGTAAETAAATIPTNKEGILNMEEIMAKLEEMNTAIEAKFAALAETLLPAEEPEEVVEEISVEAVAEALVAADLPSVSRKAVYESLRNGADLTEAIEAQKNFVADIKSHLKETAAAVAVEETIIPNTVEKAASLRDILNVKVG
jgi:predicted DNA-binding protein YlxM (UPF0122 family)